MNNVSEEIIKGSGNVLVSRFICDPKSENVKSELDTAVRFFVNGRRHNQYVDIEGDNPYVRVVIVESIL